jgi:hypothetical protein
MCAFLAMFLFVLFTFLSAGFTNLSAETQKFIGAFRIACKNRSGKLTHISTIAIEFYATCKNAYVFFIEASRKTNIAMCGTGIQFAENFMGSFHFVLIYFSFLLIIFFVMGFIVLI